jgi:Tfp pilus assembly protein PilV
MSKSKGLTLIEITIALIVLALGVVSLLVLFTLGGSTHKKGIDRITAGVIAREILSDIQQEGIKSNPEAIKDRVYPGYGGLYRYDVEFVPIFSKSKASPAYRVVVRVKWLESGGQQFVELETVILRTLPPT